ncbi:hypothetical protein [Haloferax sp. Atlit-6N]|uniref:hypothetical protein n=1 Tax=Haloferax sp. Atlit-6N TaxID=2077205 RepID=UPI001F48C042|nr:hypothetical protein [Haloferax sp. Atlit-6N]
MRQQHRRTFLKLSGSLLGGVAAGSTVVAAERTDRFIVDLGGGDASAATSADLEVVYDSRRPAWWSSRGASRPSPP